MRSTAGPKIPLVQFGGPPNKKWIEVIRDDMKRMRGRRENAHDRVKWRKVIWGEKRLTRASPAKGR